MNEIQLTATEQAQRAASIAANNSDAPVVFRALPPPGPEFSWLGHAANYRANRQLGVRCGIYHTTESESSISGALRYDARRPDKVSCTAFCGPNGELGVDVPEGSTPWTTGRWNDESVSLEVVGRAAWSAAQWRSRPAQLEGMIDWTVGVCRRHGLPPTWLTAERFAQGASPAGAGFRGGVNRGFTDHRTANNAAISLGHDPAKYSHTDVGTGLRTVINEDILPAAARRLGTEPERPQVMDFTLIAGGGTLLIPDKQPVRIADSRIGLHWQGPMQPGVHRVPVPHPGHPIPKSAVVNVTVVEPSGAGFIKVYGAAAGDGSNGNFVAFQSPDPNPALASVEQGYGTVAVEVIGGACHLIVDLMAIIV